MSVKQTLGWVLLACGIAFSPLTQAIILPAEVPTIAARAYLLLDYQSGETLTETKADERVEPASLTKLMTAYLTFKALEEGKLKPNQRLKVSEKGWKTEGSRMFLDPKVAATVDELIHGMIIQSGNDACVTLAEAISGSEAHFATKMNQQAAALGMKSTHFMNATGLPHPNHYTTARDLAKLATAIIHDFPKWYPIYSIKEYRYNNITQPNRNLLLFRDAFVDGLKTGHTNSAGFCLIASTREGGRRLISILLGADSEKSRAIESAKLLRFGLDYSEIQQVASAKKKIQEVRVWQGKAESAPVGMLEDTYLTVSKGQRAFLKAVPHVYPDLVAPIKTGQKVGELHLLFNGRELKRFPLVALAEVEQTHFLGRMWDKLKMLFN